MNYENVNYCACEHFGVGAAPAGVSRLTSCTESYAKWGRFLEIQVGPKKTETCPGSDKIMYRKCPQKCFGSDKKKFPGSDKTVSQKCPGSVPSEELKSASLMHSYRP